MDGDGGDENLKDYPIEENPELTIRSVINNQMLYQEGWGVGKIKHSLTYSGGLSRSYTRTYAPAVTSDSTGFSPYLRPAVIAVAEAMPFIELTEYDVPRLYELKGEIVIARHRRRHRHEDAGISEAPLSARRAAGDACANICPSARPSTANSFFRSTRDSPIANSSGSRCGVLRSNVVWPNDVAFL